MYAALGIDPHQAATAEAHRVGELRELLGNERAVAVGETGLDYHYGAEPKDEQRRLFEEQLELARELGLARRRPHARRRTTTRESIARARFDGHGRHALLLVAGSARGRRSSAGSTSRSPATSRIRRRRSCARPPLPVPADRILAETDSPYLAPQPLRGRPNEPAHVVHTVAALAEARGEDADELAARIDANATAAFALP